ncbi:hypothetical protein BDA99DRAFT_542257 [Phascolomyces articulosus]|uniref:Uncharacterized protein n=1 Tax=Phascolomyces articulosus TaxID=60185 RepID=A0AAD5K116_9FUNG|nr:hypothetical protein BDA99DRAFT_542257 [Phascolomyces articulosus]
MDLVPTDHYQLQGFHDFSLSVFPPQRRSSFFKIHFFKSYFKSTEDISITRCQSEHPLISQQKSPYLLVKIKRCRHPALQKIIVIFFRDKEREQNEVDVGDSESTTSTTSNICSSATSITTRGEMEGVVLVLNEEMGIVNQINEKIIDMSVIFYSSWFMGKLVAQKWERKIMMMLEGIRFKNPQAAQEPDVENCEKLTVVDVFLKFLYS